MLKQDGARAERFMVNDAAARAFRSMHRLEGQFSLLLDEQFDIIWQSESVSRMLGWDVVVGRNATEFVHPDDLELVLENMLRVRVDTHDRDNLDFAPEAAQIRVQCADESWRLFAATTYNHLDDPDIGAVLCTCAAVKDRSDVGRAIELLGTGADVDHVLPVLARLADCSMGGDTRAFIAWHHGARTRTVMAADGERLDPALATAAARALDHGLVEPLIINDLDDERLGHAGDAARAHGFRTAFVVPIMAPTGAELIGTLLVWGRTSIEFQVGAQTPIHVVLRLAALAIADSRIKRDLRWAASHDPLTELINRAEFSRHLDRVADDELALLYIDLDDFKPINDRFGHPAGDRVLVEVSRRIERCLGPDDVVGRLGGDEFAVLCPGADANARARDMAERIVATIREPIRDNGMTLRVGASVGVALGVQPLIASVLHHQADQALYTAKHAGKNTVHLAG